MNGVEIVNTICEYEVLIPKEYGGALCALGLIIVFLGLCTTGVNRIQTVLVIIAIIVGIGAVICGVGSKIKTDNIIDTKYEVTISDDVSFNEFNKYYEVIDTNGDLFTVREKK